MTQAGADGHPTEVLRRARITAILRRFAEIRDEALDRVEELDELARELAALQAPTPTQEPRRRLRLLPPLAVVGAGVSAGGDWVVRHGRSVGAGALTALAAGTIAGALLAHGSTAPHAHGVPVPTRRGTPTARVAPGDSPPPTRAAPRPTGPLPAPPLGPLVVPVRVRRPVAAPSAPELPGGPRPTPTRPGPTGSAPPSPPSVTPVPAACPVGLILQLLSIGVTICA